MKSKDIFLSILVIIIYNGYYITFHPDSCTNFPSNINEKNLVLVEIEIQIIYLFVCEN